MRKAELNISLPSFDELVTAVSQPVTKHPVQTERSCEVIKPVAQSQTLKVAAYCRVSTDHEEQQSSIRIQRQHFASVAAKHDDWEFIGIYHDIVSGTKKEKRPELLRLLSDCAMGKINLVLTKSVSRFARNTTDLLEMVRSLTANGTDIFFEREKIDTRTMDSEFLLTILASLAEDESHSIASNCRWGLQKRFESGTYRAANAPYGYDLVDGNYAVNDSEAEIVREIFRRRIAGEGCRQIADDLNNRGIPTKRAGMSMKGRMVSGRWTPQGITSLLRNEAYIGDLLLQKSYTDQNFQMKRNYGELPQYYLNDHHPAIIKKEEYETIQQILAESGKSRPQRRENHDLSGMLVCAECGSLLHHSKNRSGNSYWTCKQHRNDRTLCSMPPIPDTEVKEAYARMMDRLAADDREIINYKEKVQQEFRSENHGEVAGLEKRLHEIESALRLMERARGRQATSPGEYLSRTNELKSEKLEIERQLERMTDKRISETEELQKLVHSRRGSFLFEKDTFMKLIDQVTVHGRGHFTFHFRCGLTVEERSNSCR